MSQARVVGATIAKWWGVITGVWLTIASIALIVIALDMREDGRKDALAAGVNCWRTKTLGPYSVKDAEARNLYPPVLLEWAKAAIPQDCPEIPNELKPPRADDR